MGPSSDHERDIGGRVDERANEDKVLISANREIVWRLGRNELSQNRDCLNTSFLIR